MSGIARKKRFTKREGNVEFQVWEDENGKIVRNEIVKYEPNYYYYHKDDFKECENNPNFFVKKNEDSPYYSRVHKSCFESEETQLTLADFREDWDGDTIECYELVYCADRPVSCLDTTEEKDFFKIVRYAYNYLQIKLDEGE